MSQSLEEKAIATNMLLMECEDQAKYTSEIHTQNKSGAKSILRNYLISP